MRTFERHPATEQPIDFTAIPEDRLIALQGWAQQELEDARSARHFQDVSWRNALRAYEGIPKNPVRNVPIENAPNIVVTLGAIATDAIFAMAIDLIYSVSPILTVRAVNGKEFIEHAKALQVLVNWGVEHVFDLRPASEHSIFDDVQLGTGIYYVPWVEHTKKTKSRKVSFAGPIIRSVAVEDIFVPGGSIADLERVRWLAMRDWTTRSELEDHAKNDNWNIDGVNPLGAVDWVRSQREKLGNTYQNRHSGSLYEIYHFYAYFDIDSDGIDEDIHFVYDRPSTNIIRITWNPFDRRPFEAMRYQLRAHLFFGLGVMDMMIPFQEEATVLHNERTLNTMLANARLWKGRAGQGLVNTTFYPNKVIELNNPRDDLVPEQMGDVYPSIGQGEAITISLAERRVGVNELSLPRPSQVMGSRTPANTALALLQQTNRRFTPAFDSIRLATGAAVKQCLYRYQEQLLSGNKKLEKTFVKVLGAESAALVIELLKSEDFDEQVSISLTAAGASVNRDQDKQNALLLVNVLAQYYERTLQLVSIASNPQTPKPIAETARKIADAAGEIIERTIRTFDSIRDPATFIIDVNEEIDQNVGDLPPEGLNGLGSILGILEGAAGSGPAANGDFG